MGCPFSIVVSCLLLFRSEIIHRVYAAAIKDSNKTLKLGSTFSRVGEIRQEARGRELKS